MLSKEFIEEVTPITVTCDSYLDLLPNYFSLYKKYSSLPKPLIIGETKKLESFDIFTAGDKPWGKRLCEALEKVDTKYILFTLEDYYFQTNIDNYVEQALEILKEKDYDKIALIANSHFSGYKLSPTEIPNFYKMLPNCHNLATLQMGLWKKTTFEETLNPTFSPWDFEMKGRDSLVNNRCGVLDSNKELIFNFARKGKVFSDGWQEFLRKENLMYNRL